jgi:hypothetical protein
LKYIQGYAKSNGIPAAFGFAAGQRHRRVHRSRAGAQGRTAIFLERYTNAAQDVILQGLKLVGVRYRLGGNDEDQGWTAAALSASSSRTASVPRCRVPPRK